MEAEKKNKVRKVIIDTDPGIDDAMAIMIALKEHKKRNIDIIAITLVNGNSSTDNAQVNILRVLEVFDLQNEVLNINLETWFISRVFSYTCNHMYDDTVSLLLRFPFLLDQVEV